MTMKIMYSYFEVREGKQIQDKQQPSLKQVKKIQENCV